MDKSIDQRVIQEGKYLSTHKSTIRKTAKYFHVSKSSIHVDINKRLKWLDYQLYLECRQVIALNIAERHIRGGESTKAKYSKLKHNKS